MQGETAKWTRGYEKRTPRGVFARNCRATCNQGKLSLKTESRLRDTDDRKYVSLCIALLRDV